MITKTNEIDKVEVVGDFKMVQIREATIIKEDGVELTRSFNRRVITPSSDISGESSEIQSLCAIYHTQSVKDAYIQFLADQE